MRWVFMMSAGLRVCDVWTKQPDCRWNEGPAVVLLPPLQMYESAAEGAASEPHSLIKGVSWADVLLLPSSSPESSRQFRTDLSYWASSCPSQSVQLPSKPLWRKQQKLPVINLWTAPNNVLHHRLKVSSERGDDSGPSFTGHVCCPTSLVYYQWTVIDRPIWLLWSV